MTQQTGDTSSTLCSLGSAESTTRTHYILKGHRDHGMAGKKVDFLYVSMGICSSSVERHPRYVDEVQDNLLIDTLRMH